MAETPNEMPRTFYQDAAGGGYHDAHGRAVDEDGNLLDPSADDPNNISAQEAEAAEEARGEDAPAPKKGKRK